MVRGKEKVYEAAGSAKPYVDRALHDEELRENVRNAYAAAREIYEELVGSGRASSVATKLATDTEIHENLRTAIDELRTAARRVQGREEHRRSGAALLITGIAIGILFNPVTGPDTRRWLKEKLVGGDEFGYGSSSSDGSN
jgi:hypothetical protein